MQRVLCSTGAFIGRPNGRDYRLIKLCADSMDCDGFEFMMYEDWYDKRDEIEEFMKTVSKPVVTFHAEKNVGELISRNEPGDTEEAVRLFRMNCDMAKRLKAEKMVLHLWNGLHSDKDFAHNASMYPELRDIAEAEGILLTVENVVCNVGSPMEHLKELLALYPDISFTFDTKMAEFHGELEELYAEENRELFGHIAHMHINDYKGGVKDWGCLKTLHLGKGQVDFDRLFNFLKKIGYTGDFTIESTSFDKTGTIDFAAMRQSVDRVRRLLK